LERKTAFTIFLFILTFLLFNWPLTGITTGENPLYNFIYIFTVWLLIIISLFIMRKDNIPVDTGDKELNKKEERHV